MKKHPRSAKKKAAVKKPVKRPVRHSKLAVPTPQQDWMAKHGPPPVTEALKQLGSEPRTPATQIAFEDLTGEEGSTRVDLTEESTGTPRWSRWNPQTRAFDPYDLLPYQPSIEDLWHRLCMADIPLPMGEVMANLDAFTSCAKKLLFLLSHQPWEYRALRADAAAFVEEIERWSDLNVPRTRSTELVTMMLCLHNKAHRDATAAAGQ